MTEKERILKKAIQLNEERKYQKVDDLLTNEILEKYKDAILYSEKALALTRLNRKEELEQLVKISYELFPNEAKINAFQGAVFYNKSEIEKAENYYLKAIRINPNIFYPYMGLGNIYKDKKEYKIAEDYYLKVIQLDPYYSGSYNAIGNIYFDKKEYEKAKEYYNRAIEIDSNYSNPYIGLGNIYSQKREFKKAEEYYLKAIKIDPRSSLSHNGMGNVYYKKREYEKAKKHFLNAIKIDPNYSSPYNGLGAVYKAKKEFKKAEENYDIAIKLNAELPSPYYNKAIMFFESKDYQKAKEFYQKYIDLKNDNEDYSSKFAKSRIEEIDKILDNSSYKKISNLINQIKNLLLFSGECITHYTSISTVQILVLNGSSLRLSEGSFLNDTSEGEELFKFLDDFLIKSKNNNEEIFTKRPFIGSFVDAEKNNDLTLWRMYGKENLEEAKGCSITINAQELKKEIKIKVNPNSENNITNTDDIEFYRVAYRNNNSFEFAGATTATNKKLTDLMQSLKNEIQNFKKKTSKKKNEEVEIIELLNSIAYLFKSIEYKYENEIRLVINEAIGFDRKMDFGMDEKGNFTPSINPNKVYIELVPLCPLLKTITIGPKVAKAEEWASTFHYHLLNNNHNPEIHISKIPFK